MDYPPHGRELGPAVAIGWISQPFVVKNVGLYLNDRVGAG
jgi:hypothetical protein